MKKILFLVMAATLAAVNAAPFVTPGMTKRNGLTDAQYEALWRVGKNPRIDQTAARDWIFRAGRYQNVTNWLDICGTSNNFAKLSYKLQDDNFKLEETNAVLVATNTALTATCIKLAGEVVNQWNNYTNQLAQTVSFSNAYVIASNAAKIAADKILDEIGDLQAKISKYEEYRTKYPLLKTVWNALIADAENRIKILQALTGE